MPIKTSTLSAEEREKRDREIKALRRQARIDAITTPAKTAETVAMEQAALRGQADVTGQKAYDKNKWRGGGLLGAGLAAGLNKLGWGRGDSAQERSDTAYQGLEKTRALTATEAARQNLAKATATIEGEDFSTRERVGGQNFDRDRQDDRFGQQTSERLETQNFASTAGESQPYQSLTDPDDIVNTIEVRDGSKWVVDANNKPTVPFNPQGYIEWTPPAAEGSRGTANAAIKRKDLMELNLVQDNIAQSELGRLFSDPTFLSGTATGGANIFAMGKGFNPLNLDQEKVQVTRGIMDGITVDTVIPMMKTFGGNPSDAERTFVMSGMPNKGQDPLRWFDWAENKFLAKSKAAALRASRNNAAGAKTEEQIEMSTAEFKRMIQRQRAEYIKIQGGEDTTDADTGAGGTDFGYSEQEEADYQAYKASFLR